MPLVNIHLCADHPDHQKTALMSACVAAVAASLQTPDTGVHVFLRPYEAHHAQVAAGTQSELVVYEIHMIQGRSPAQKSALIAALNAASVQCLGIPNTASRTVIHEIPKENFGVAGGVSAAGPS